MTRNNGKTQTLVDVLARMLAKPGSSYAVNDRGDITIRMSGSSSVFTISGKGAADDLIARALKQAGRT